MIILKPEDYGKLVGPVKAIPFNTLFAKAVLYGGHVGGTVFVDDPEDIGAFYILHPYGMSLLAGERGNREFEDWLRGYLLNSDGQRSVEYLQVWPEGWGGTVREMAGAACQELGEGDPLDAPPDKIVLEDVRFNFRFAGRRDVPALPGVEIVRTGAALFDEMEGSVIPKKFWKDGKHFEEKSMGFSALVDGKLAATTFAAFVIKEEGKTFLEIGIETVPEFRGKGIGKLACARMVDHCLENDLEPVWSCRVSNRGSAMIAEAIGFEEERRVGYWTLR